MTREIAARQTLTYTRPPDLPPSLLLNLSPSTPRALLEDLMDRMDMAEATDVVISGCSAGAVQTYINTGASLQTERGPLLFPPSPSSSFPSPPPFMH